jgi:hypothetical protein
LAIPGRSKAFWNKGKILVRWKEEEMANPVQAASGRTLSSWIGWVMSGLAIAFLLMDSTMKLLALPIVIETSGPLGFAGADMAVLGAILLTGFLGGTVATHIRVGSPLFTHALFGVYLGVMLWGGLYLRDARLRALVPLRTTA